MRFRLILCSKGVAAFERAEYFISFQAIPHKKCGCAAFIFNEKVTLKLLCINQRAWACDLAHINTPGRGAAALGARRKMLVGVCVYKKNARALS
jgi:hypothetical protein